MATICCPNCQTQIQKPTNVVAWVLGTLAALFVGGFLIIVICLSAVTAIGANANVADSKFDNVRDNTTQVRYQAPRRANQPTNR